MFVHVRALRMTHLESLCDFRVFLSAALYYIQIFVKFIYMLHIIFLLQMFSERGG